MIQQVEAVCSQAWQLAFTPWDTHGRRSELTPYGILYLFMGTIVCVVCATSPHKLVSIWIKLLFMCVLLFCLYACLCTCVQCLWRLREGDTSPGAGATMVVGCHVVLRIKPRLSGRAVSIFNPCSISPAKSIIFKKARVKSSALYLWLRSSRRRVPKTGNRKSWFWGINEYLDTSM